MFSVVAASAVRPASINSRFDTLEALGVPYILYDWTGQRLHISASVLALVSNCADVASLLMQLDRIAPAEVGRVASRSYIGHFALRRDLRSSSGRVAAALYVEAAGSQDARAVAVLRPLGATPSTTIAGLTPRESDVARLIAAGLSTKEIAQRLAISPHTARHHIERLFARLGVTSRAAAAAIVASSVTLGSTSHNRTLE